MTVIALNNNNNTAHQRQFPMTVPQPFQLGTQQQEAVNFNNTSQHKQYDSFEHASSTLKQLQSKNLENINPENLNNGGKNNNNNRRHSSSICGAYTAAMTNHASEEKVQALETLVSQLQEEIQEKDREIGHLRRVVKERQSTTTTTTPLQHSGMIRNLVFSNFRNQ